MRIISKKTMISSENLICYWTLLCLVCFVEICISTDVQTSAEEGSSPKFKYNGHWAPWAEWSKCSRTCGGGVRMRSRICRTRSNGYIISSSACLGETKEYELCSIQNCFNSNEKEFLEYQCSRQNGRIIAGKKINEWIPYHHILNPCELQCWSKDRSVVQSFGKTIDGTKCTWSDPQQSAVCVNGRCSVVGCHGKIRSARKLDRCGICGGNNSTCTKFQRTFWKKPRFENIYNALQFDYEKVLDIPMGSTNILISKISRTNFLALGDPKGKFFLNGNWRVQSPGKFYVHGTEFQYNKTADGLETLSSAGPAKQMLVIYILGSDDVPTVHAEYWYTSLTSASTHNFYNAERKTQVARVSKPPSLITSKTTALPKRQGYNSYYHRNEILKSVPSWSIKRHSTYKNPLNILSFQTHNQSEEKRHFGNGFYRRYSAITDDDFALQTSRNIRTTTTDVPTQLKNVTSDILDSYILHLDSYGRPKGTLPLTGKAKVFHYNVHKGKVEESPSKNKTKGKKNKIIAEDETSATTLGPKFQKKKQSHNKRKRKSENDNCSSCNKVKHQTKNFCLSEFVLRIVVLSSENGEQHSSRFEVEVLRSYKNKIPILPREYLWTNDQCLCPKLRVGKEYILMGNSRTFKGQRESRLMIDHSSFVRKYTPKRARRMLRLVKDQHSVCKKF